MTEKKRSTVTKRTGKRLVRAAYDFESLSYRLREAGMDGEAGFVLQAARRLGEAGRGVLDKTNG